MALTLQNIFDDFLNKKSYSIIRLGNVEASTIYNKIEYENLDKTQLKTNAGFYGNKDDYIFWKNQFIKALYNCDARMKVITCDSFIICDYLFNDLNIWKPTIPYVESPEIYISLINAITKSKRVCIVNYFKDEIEEQLPIINKVWNDKYNIYYKNINVVKSENTCFTQPHNGYKETFEDLCKRVYNKDIKYYMVGCGIYGVPLCQYIKEQGGNALYVGGLLPTIFGIGGRRFDKRKDIMKHFNMYWKYPPKKYHKEFEKIENGCYI